VTPWPARRVCYYFRPVRWLGCRRLAGACPQLPARHLQPCRRPTRWFGGCCTLACRLCDADPCTNSEVAAGLPANYDTAANSRADPGAAVGLPPTLILSQTRSDAASGPLADSDTFSDQGW